MEKMKWVEILGLLIKTLDTGDRGKARVMAIAELTRMAKLADLGVDLVDFALKIERGEFAGCVRESVVVSEATVLIARAENL